MLYNAPRAATIVAKGDVELWSLDRNTFTHILKTAMQKKREKYDNFLDQVEILKTLEKAERQKLADALKDCWYEEGDYCIREGDKNGDQFFMVMEGDCVATKVLEPGKPALTVKGDRQLFWAAYDFGWDEQPGARRRACRARCRGASHCRRGHA